MDTLKEIKIQTPACKIQQNTRCKQKLIKPKNEFQQNQGKSEPRETKENEKKHQNKIRKEIKALQEKRRI